METRHSWLKETGQMLRLIFRHPTGRIGLLLMIGFCLISFVGPSVVSRESEAHLSERNQGPSLKHLLGTDFQGKDNLIQVIWGGKEILIIAFATGTLTTLLAVAIGAFSAWAGGRVDSLLMEITNVWLTLPRFPLLVAIAASLKLTNIWLLSLLLAALSWPGFARQVRSQVLSLKKRDYIEAAQVLNLGTPHIIFKEILPNMRSFIVISLIFAMTNAIYQQTGLVFLGLIPLSGTNWGELVSLALGKNALYQSEAAWSVFAPVGAIILFQLSLVLIAGALEEVFNPRLRTRAKE